MELLISVNSATEVLPALEGGATIIDVKDPAAGALGAASAQVLREVCAQIPAGHLSSAALGDSDMPLGALTLAAYAAASFGVRYIKVGLVAQQVPAAITLLREIQASARLANARCGLIAVGYADADEIGGLAWQTLPEIAHAAQIEGCMIDTALKDGRGLFDHCTEGAIAAWLSACRAADLQSALAGSLKLADLARVIVLSPNIAGFRSAACRGDRVSGQVDARRVATLKAELSKSFIGSFGSDVVV